MKHFLWLAIKERLLTNALRYKRHMAADSRCNQCQHQEESVIHIFRNCPIAVDIWKSIVGDEDWNRFASIPDHNWLSFNLRNSFINNLNKEVSWMAIFMATIWCLWKSRNQAIFRGNAQSKSQLIFMIKRVSGDLQGKLEPNCAYIRKKKWERPPAFCKKLNVDGSVRSQSNTGAIGCVLRDEKGEWIWGYAEMLRQPTVNEAELRSLLKGLEMSWDQRIRRIQVEVDSEVIYKWMKGEEEPPADMEELARKCKELIRKPWDISINKIDREANKCADHLARLGYLYNCEGQLWLNPPISVVPILGSDIG